VSRQAMLVRAALHLLLVLAGLALLAFLGWRWPLWTLLGAYLLVFALLTVSYVRRVFYVSWRMDDWNSFLVDLANTDLTSDAPLIRLRRRLSASLLILALAALWPLNLVTFALMRPWFRRDATGQVVPRTGSLESLVYLQFVLKVGLFALLPLAVLWFAAGTPAQPRIALILAWVLALHLFARHTAMLVFPHDLKATMRRTLGDPRLMFVIMLCVDVFAFAVLAWYLGGTGGSRDAGVAVIHERILALVSISEWRALVDALKPAFAPGAADPLGMILTRLGQVRPAQAAEMACSGFVYLNLVRMLFPLSEWKRTDEERRFLARFFLVSGLPQKAREYLERVSDYDVATGRLDALVTASAGDLKGAASKVRWVHARNALGEDPDLVFLDAVLPAIGVPRSRLNLAVVTGFALDTGVGDTVLTMGLLMAAYVGRFDLARAHGQIEQCGAQADYPLCLAAIALDCGAVDEARGILAGYRADDLAGESAAALLGEVAAGHQLPHPPPSLPETTQRIAERVASLEPDALPLARQITLISILIWARLLVSVSGGSPAALEQATDQLLRNIRTHHPSHRDYADQVGNFARVAQVQARRQGVAAAP